MTLEPHDTRQSPALVSPGQLRRLRVALVITRAHAGGAQTHVAELIRALHERIELHLVAGEVGTLTDAAAGYGVAVHVMPAITHRLSLRNDVSAARALHRLMRTIKPDLVHSHTSKAGLLTRLFASGCAHVHTSHGWSFQPGAPIKTRAASALMEATLAHRADRIICVSESDRHLARALPCVGNGRAITIYPGIHAATEPHPPERGRADGLLRLVCVARFVPQKDQPALLRSLQLLGAEASRIQVAFIGDGPTRASCEALAQQLGVAPHVAFLGNRDDVLHQLLRYDALVLPSHYEGLPISILEAMRAGLPVIASDVGGVREAVLDGRSGMLVPRGQPAEFTRVWRELLAQPARLTALGEAGRRHFQNTFTAEACMPQLLGEYHSLAAAHGATWVS